MSFHQSGANVGGAREVVDVDFEIVFQGLEGEVASLGGGFEEVEVVVQEVE